MDDSIGSTISTVSSTLARKKGKHSDEWKNEKLKILRYSSKELPEYPKCKHNTKAYQCRSLKMQDILTFHENFYRSKDKIQQDNFILNHTSLEKPKRHRPKTSSRSEKSYTFKYFVRRVDGIKVPVCRTAYLNILVLKRHRVQGVMKRSFKCGGSGAKETRGGDRKSSKNISKKMAVMKFIESFTAQEPHYCRSKTSVRLYLPSELNIKSMWKMYNKGVELHLKVKQSFFRNIFNKQYNLGFGTPRVDVCSKCLEIGEKIKTEKEPTEQQNLITQHRVHKLKAKAFFHMLQEKRDGLLTISFDCQKNMSLPKVPDQRAYFSRQWNFYNFTIVVGSSHDALTKSNVHIYYWNETDRPKSSNEIASAVFHRLCQTDLKNIDTVRLFADGCGGQNKNTTLMGMLSKWLVSFAPENVKTVQVIFPIVGHSFIPPDRVFAQIEKKLRKIEIIIKPEEYVNILKDHGTVWNINNLEINDWKSATLEIIKPPGQWHFKFNPSKRFILQKTTKRNNITIRGEEAYRVDLGSDKLVVKKGKTVNNLVPPLLTTGMAPNAKKIKDVSALLEAHYGANWRELENLKFYATVEQSTGEAPTDDLVCEEIEERDIYV
ncbi:unnamed protein product [Diabrotica balteata]|uniref:DUF7869 domain-containing protein n=1 Tax=Diabrotica balteata TaxID=107213 RepID=A0A9N9T3B8_DIABA|nr:unnamed protein product [Diabrotica balteata]